MTLQHIRRYYEQPIVDWCADNNVELRVDNMLEPGGDAAGCRNAPELRPDDRRQSVWAA